MILALLFGGILCFALQKTFITEKTPVFLFSIDGLRYDYLKKFHFPNFQYLIENGASDLNGVESVYPAVTFPSHTSIITGVYPEQHGVLNNNVFDPSRLTKEMYVFADQIKVPTIFQAAKQKNLKISSIQWSVSAFDKSLDMNLPDFPTNTPTETNLVYKGAISTEIQKKIGGISKYKKMTDEDRMNLFLDSLEQKEFPDLNALHLIDFDHAQHVNGCFSDDAIKALQKHDQLIGKFIRKLKEKQLFDQSYIMVVSDHGFTNFTYTLAPNGLDQGPEWKAQFYLSPGVAALYLNPKYENDINVQNKVRSSLNFLISSDLFGIKRSIIGFDEVEKAQLNGFPGAYALLESRLGYIFVDSNANGQLLSDAPIPYYRATHGYNPSEQEMRATFIMTGPNIKKTKLKNVRLVDYAPTISKILGLNMTNMKGRVLNEIFKF